MAPQQPAATGVVNAAETETAAGVTTVQKRKLDVVSKQGK